MYKDIELEHRDIAMLYMVLGGIPFYLNHVKRGMSVSQNIDALCFAKDAPLFSNPARHLRILEILAAHRNGMMREELLAQAAF
ncbi:MAG: hypothetical protein LBN22_00305 [Clostridiales Family XIII bacterium]|nr:hypothetical protein [Clostridiales Family XIII bacterium]